jgi:hypothetical protein
MSTERNTAAVLRDDPELQARAELFRQAWESKEVKGLRAVAAAQFERWKREWEEKFGVPMPLTPEEMTVWSARVGFKPDELSKVTLGKLLLWIEGHIMGQQDLQSQPKKTLSKQQADSPRDKRRDPRPLIVAELNRHHNYNDPDGELNYEPLGVGELARRCGVAKSTVSKFFRQKPFEGHEAYGRMCQRPEKLQNALQRINGELPSMILDYIDCYAPAEVAEQIRDVLGCRTDKRPRPKSIVDFDNDDWQD